MLGVGQKWAAYVYTRGEGELGRVLRVTVVGGFGGGAVMGMACGQTHSLEATAEGRVLVFGSRRTGRLALGAEGGGGGSDTGRRSMGSPWVMGRKEKPK